MINLPNNVDQSLTESERAVARWRAGCELLWGRPAPRLVQSDRWSQIKSDCLYIADEWGFIAFDLGWSTIDLFGVDPNHPVNRYDRMGLAWSRQGRTIVEFSKTRVVLAAGSNSRLVVRRRPMEGAVPICALSLPGGATKPGLMEP